MTTEYNKSHIQGILKKNGKNSTLHNFALFLWRSHFKNSCFGCHQVSSIALHLSVNALMLDLSSSIFVLISLPILGRNSSFQILLNSFALKFPSFITLDSLGTGAAGPQLPRLFCPLWLYEGDRKLCTIEIPSITMTTTLTTFTTLTTTTTAITTTALTTTTTTRSYCSHSGWTVKPKNFQLVRCNSVKIFTHDWVSFITDCFALSKALTY